MIRELTVENCYSFLSPVNLSFHVSQKAPATNRYQKSVLDNERLSKVVGIFGANASGKSNLLRVIDFLKWFVVDSFRKRPDGELPLHPFLLTEPPFGPTNIEVEFEHGTTVYRYRVVVLNSVVETEELNVLDLTLSRERKRFKQLFSRTLKDSRDEYSIKSHVDFKLSEGIREIASRRTNASLISAALLSNHEQSLSLKEYWDGVVTQIKQLDENVFSIFESTEFYHKNEKFKLSMEKMMAMCDLGLVGLDIEKTELPQLSASRSGKNEFFTPWGRHPGVAGKVYRLPFMLESAGTQQIYVLLSTLLPVLESGGLAVIDELETDLHPELLPTLLGLFESPDTNPNAAQLVFTSHSTPLLNSLDQYQVVIVEKDATGVSNATRLDQIDGVRADENHFAKYHSGRIRWAA